MTDIYFVTFQSKRGLVVETQFDSEEEARAVQRGFTDAKLKPDDGCPVTMLTVSSVSGDVCIDVTEFVACAVVSYEQNVARRRMMMQLNEETARPPARVAQFPLQN